LKNFAIHPRDLPINRDLVDIDFTISLLSRETVFKAAAAKKKLGRGGLKNYLPAGGQTISKYIVQRGSRHFRGHIFIPALTSIFRLKSGVSVIDGLRVGASICVDSLLKLST
jgi:hypothetical protein